MGKTIFFETVAAPFVWERGSFSINLRPQTCKPLAGSRPYVPYTPWEREKNAFFRPNHNFPLFLFSSACAYVLTVRRNGVEPRRRSGNAMLLPLPLSSLSLPGNNVRKLYRPLLSESPSVRKKPGSWARAACEEGKLCSFTTHSLLRSTAKTQGGRRRRRYWLFLSSA